jgi:hypothetical protein
LDRHVETRKVSTIKAPAIAEDRKIRAAARADPDAQALTHNQLREMVQLKTLRGHSRFARKANPGPASGS